MERGRFCPECGTPLGDDAVAARAPALPVAERRIASIMFGDIVGFTPLSETRDAEEVRELLSRYFAPLDDRLGNVKSRLEAIHAVVAAAKANLKNPPKVHTETAILQNQGVKQLVVTGVTTEVCVNTTVREANDRGYDCIVPEDCVGSYFPEFQQMGLKMIKAQGGIFGWVSDSTKILAALTG